MCGRYAASARPDELIEAFDVDEDHTGEPARSVLKSPQSPPPGEPDWNMAPSKQAPVVLTRRPRGADGRDGAPEEALAVRQLRMLTWGLVPVWSKDVSTGLRMTNARAESVLGKGAFAKAALSRRCLVPAKGWYEWQVSPTAVDAKGKPRKQPFFIHRADGAPVAFAGLYEFWRDKEVEDPEDPLAWLTSFTIITTDAEPGLDRIHDRQPLVLERDDWSAWLDPATDPDEVAALLAFEQPGRFDAYPISSEVNNTRNNGPDLLSPLPREELHGVVDLVTGEVVGA
jgi:putative SOS response-associated peptidase YedK